MIGLACGRNRLTKVSERPLHKVNDVGGGVKWHCRASPGPIFQRFGSRHAGLRASNGSLAPGQARGDERWGWEMVATHLPQMVTCLTGAVC
jgi:hypothetical protein